MSERRCKHCLSNELHSSRPAWWDCRGLSLLVRPVRCRHCERRQYVPANRGIETLTVAFRRLDAGLELLHPQSLLRLLSRSRDSLPPSADG